MTLRKWHLHRLLSEMKESALWSPRDKVFRAEIGADTDLHWKRRAWNAIKKTSVAGLMTQRGGAGTDCSTLRVRFGSSKRKLP